jgi:DNA (cytosine-5)-methyltransferase 1
MPTPRATDGTKGGPNQRGSSGDLMLPSAVTHLLPTPAVNDMGAGKTVEHWDEWTAAMQAKHGNGNGHGKSLAIETLRLLPTPRARDAQPEGQAAGERRMELYATGTLSTVLALLPTGASTPPPSTDGNTSSDAERLPLPRQDPKVDRD